jgi:preprotein translocase subunit YajC
MHWNVILADTPAPAHSTPAAPSAPGASTATTATTAAQPGQPAQPAAPFGGGMSLLFPLVLIVLIMYFMSIRPQQQRAKQMAKLLASIKSGDKVVTSSGIVGVVITVKDKTVSLRSADTKMEVTKASISEIVQNDDTQTSP